MEDIAAVVGIRGSSLYNHVSSKQELLADIMVTTMRDLLYEFEKATVDGDPAARLRNAMQAHVRYHGTHRPAVRIGNRERTTLQPPDRDLVRDLRHQYARHWQTLIQEGLDDGTFHALSAQLAAYALLEMGIGVSQWYREDGAMSLDDIAFHYGEMALRQAGVMPDATTPTTTAAKAKPLRRPHAVD
jgi:AcrR family transcriptional regulator